MLKRSGEIDDFLQVEADVVVIGGGTAGLVLAVKLRRKGLRVSILESGFERQSDETHALNEVVQLADRYAGADAGRFRCLGGTSTRWGGALIPFQPGDFEQHAGWDARWPVGAGAMSAYRGEVEKIFGLTDTPYEAPELAGAATGFVPRLAKWPPFGNRNVASLFREDIESDAGPEIWLDATVTGFELDGARRLCAVEASASNGRKLRARAREFVIAAGAIESTRLLLLLDRSSNDRLFAPHDVLGRYFHDHLSVQTARVSVREPRRFNRVVGFRFEGATMRNLRFEPSLDLRRSLGAPAAFAHISFGTDTPGAFDALRSILRRYQQRQLPAVSDLTLLASSVSWLLRALWWRFFEKRLLSPADAAFELHMVVEQEPLARNRIGLSADRRDALGIPLATIDWKVDPSAARHAIALTECFQRFWKASPLAATADFDPMPPARVAANLESGGGVYHPGGTTRMGMSAADGVVDAKLRTFAIPNLSVVSTSVFPTGGGANPTMMLLMAALQCADRISTTRP